jgi:hypothetical protein
MSFVESAAGALANRSPLSMTPRERLDALLSPHHAAEPAVPPGGSGPPTPPDNSGMATYFTQQDAARLKADTDALAYTGDNVQALLSEVQAADAVSQIELQVGRPVRR